jgi:hypothetical protein
MKTPQPRGHGDDGFQFMTMRWIIVFSVAGLFSGQAFADCLPAPDTPARSSNIFRNSTSRCPNSSALRKPLPPQASEEPSQEPPQAYEDTPEAPAFEWNDDDSDHNGRFGPRYGWCFSEKDGKHPCDPPRYGWCFSEKDGKHPCSPPRNHGYDY